MIIWGIVVFLIVLISYLCHHGSVCLFFSMQWLPCKICIWEYFFLMEYTAFYSNHSISFPSQTTKAFFLFCLNKEITVCHSHIVQMCNLALRRSMSLFYMKQALLPFFVGPHYLGVRVWFGLVNRQWCSLGPFFFPLPSFSSSLPFMPEEEV